MIKNGLFICSIGLLFFLYSTNPNGSYRMGILVIALLLIGSGGLLFYKGMKKEKQNKKENIQQSNEKEGKQNGNRKKT